MKAACLGNCRQPAGNCHTKVGSVGLCANCWCPVHDLQAVIDPQPRMQSAPAQLQHSSGGAALHGSVRLLRPDQQVPWQTHCAMFDSYLAVWHAGRRRGPWQQHASDRRLKVVIQAMQIHMLLLFIPEARTAVHCRSTACQEAPVTQSGVLSSCASGCSTTSACVPLPRRRMRNCRWSSAAPNGRSTLTHSMIAAGWRTRRSSRSANCRLPCLCRIR